MSDWLSLLSTPLGWLVVMRFSTVFAARAQRWAILTGMQANQHRTFDHTMPPLLRHVLDVRKWTYRQFFPAPPEPYHSGWSARILFPVLYQQTVDACEHVPVFRGILEDAELLPTDTHEDPQRWLMTIKILHRMASFNQTVPPSVPRH